MSFFLAQVLKPFALLAILGGLLLCRYLVIWYWPEGRLKRLLLLRVDYAGQAERRRSRNDAQGFSNPAASCRVGASHEVGGSSWIKQRKG